jgi:hypothetical protein
MNRIIGVAAVLLVLGCAEAARASWPCGIYARIDKVELGPANGDKPTWIKVYGDFIMVKTSCRLCGPERGFMYFHAVEGKEDLCKLEWADLQKIAGTKANFVAFGSAHAERKDDLGRDGNTPNVHKKEDPSTKSIAYPLNHGLTRLRVEQAEESDHEGNPNPVVLLRKYLTDHPLKSD